MRFPSVEQSKALEASLSPAARKDLARLKKLIRHAKNSPWLKGREDVDRCAVIEAVLVDMGASHVKIVECDVLILGHRDSARTDTIHAHGLCVFDAHNILFFSARGERNEEIAIRRCVNETYPGAKWERVSTWGKPQEHPFFPAASNPRNHPVGRVLVEEGLSVLRHHELSKTTPLSVSRPWARRL